MPNYSQTRKKTSRSTPTCNPNYPRIQLPLPFYIDFENSIVTFYSANTLEIEDPFPLSPHCIMYLLI